MSIPYLWDGILEKNNWGALNFLIGPNGTGKTIFVNELQRHFPSHGLHPRYLSAERLAGLERQQYGTFSSQVFTEASHSINYINTKTKERHTASQEMHGFT